MNAYEKIGQKLQKAREEAGMSQEELARRIGCSQAALSYYELGKRRLYVADLEKISNILNRPLTYFLENKEEFEPDQGDLRAIFKEAYMKEILLKVRELKVSQRKSVLEYIDWQRSKSEREK